MSSWSFSRPGNTPLGPSPPLGLCSNALLVRVTPDWQDPGMVMGYTHKHICHLFVCHAFLAPLLSFQKWTGAAAVSFLLIADSNQIINQPSAVTREGTTHGAFSCDCANSHNRATGRVYQLTKLATRLTGVSTQLPRLLASHLSTQVKLDKASPPGSCSSPGDHMVTCCGVFLAATWT